MQAAEQIIVLTIGAREEGREMSEADPLEALLAVEPGKRGGILRTDPVDQNLVKFPGLLGGGGREVRTSQNGNPR